MVQLSNCQVVELSNRRIVKSPNFQIVELSDRRIDIVDLSNRPIGKISNCQIVKMSHHLIIATHRSVRFREYPTKFDELTGRQKRENMDRAMCRNQSRAAFG